MLFYQYYNYKQIGYDGMLVTFFRTSRTGTLAANKFDDSIIVTCF